MCLCLVRSPKDWRVQINEQEAEGGSGKGRTSSQTKSDPGKAGHAQMMTLGNLLTSLNSGFLTQKLSKEVLVEDRGDVCKATNAGLALRGARQRLENRECRERECRPEGPGAPRAPYGRPETPGSGPRHSRPRCFPCEECKSSGPAAEARPQRLRQPGPPSPGPGTWRRAAPAAPLGRTGLCRRRAPARAASRGLGRPGHPPRQGTLQALPALATGGSAYRPDRHTRAGAPSSAGLAPSSPPGTAYPAQARRARSRCACSAGGAGPGRRADGRGLLATGGEAFVVGRVSHLCWSSCRNWLALASP